MYDALNRIKKADYLTQHQMTGDFSGESEDYGLSLVDYDKNGNITELKRNGATADFEIDVIDNLSYNYYPNSNQFNRHEI